MEIPAPLAGPDAQEAKLHAQKQQLATAILMLERAQIIDFNGHFSARLPGGEGFLINSGASCRSALTADDICAVDPDGKPLAGGPPPPMEFHIHAEIYRSRADVHAVVHTHPLWSTVLGIAGHRIRPVIMQAAVLGEIRHFDPISSINTRELGQALAAELAGHRVVTLQSHGAVIAAEGILEAFVLACYLEENAQRQYLAAQCGDLRVLAPAEIATIWSNLWKPNLLQKVWEYHYAKLRAQPR
jgi:ribulose-5-phosphate 4-epimerase/fuculose-1-phosphate aldolase